MMNSSSKRALPRSSKSNRGISKLQWTPLALDSLHTLTVLATCLAWAGLAQAKDTAGLKPVVVTGALGEYRQFNTVEVTGSSILAPAAKDALPIQVLTRRDIERSGAASLPEFLQSLSVMSNFQELGSVPGTLLGGPEAASIHGRQSGTLVLLNGRRLPVYGSQTIAGERAIVDLNMLPLAAVERIEILTDGASSRYGSDAIAGVVNVITRTSQVGVSIAADYIRPRGGDAQGQGLSLSWGKGSFRTDGYSLHAHLSVQRQDELTASTRPNAGESVIPLSIDGQQLNSIVFNYLRANGAPATIQNADKTYQPYAGSVNGQCPAGWYALALKGVAQCLSNTQAGLSIYPKVDKTHFFAQGEVAISTDHALFGELLIGQSAQTMSVAAPSAYSQTFADGTTALAQTTPLGALVQQYTSDNHRVTAGAKGRILDWNYVGSAYHGSHRVDRLYVSGLYNASALRKTGLTKDELLQDPSAYSAETIAKFESSHRPNYWLDTGKSTLKAIETIASKTLVDLDNGPVQLGLGATFHQESIEYTSYSQKLRPAFDGNRRVGALHGELSFPVAADADLTTSLRQDHYSDFGDVTTGKLGAKWKPAPGWLLRGSAGTGFRAPTLAQMSDVSSPLADTYDAVTKQAVGVVYKGNQNLQPETSRQASLGARWEPSQRFSMGADVWQVEVKNTFGLLSPSRVLASNLRNEYLRTTGETQFLELVNSNLGNSQKQGIDYDVQWREPTDVGRAWVSFKGTYMLESKVQSDPGQPFERDLARYSNGAYTPKHSVRLTGGLENAGWSVSAAVNYLSGNTEAVDLWKISDGIRTSVPRVKREVPGYWTLDLGSRWQINRQMTLAAGLINVLDKDPPLRFSTSGTLIGIDTRYGSSYGRTLRLRLEAKF